MIFISLKDVLFNISIISTYAPLNGLENIDTVSEVSDKFIIISFLMFFALILSSRSNSALRKQWRTEDDWDASYLPFWCKLILFPRYLFSQKRFKTRTIIFKKFSLIPFIVALLICLLPINLRIRIFVPYVYLFWSLFLAILFKQETRGL